MLSSRSSLRITWTLRAIVVSLLLLRASGLSNLLPRDPTAPLHHNAEQCRASLGKRVRDSPDRVALLVDRADQWEQDGLPNAQAGERHHQAVHAHTHPAGGRHA